MAHFEAQVSRIVYAGDKGWAVLEAKGDHDGVAVKVTGNLAHLKPGEAVTFRGEWEKSKKWGHQFKATSVEIVVPVTVIAIRGYLATLDGCGPVRAEAIASAFGVETMGIVWGDQAALADVPGIGITVAIQIQRSALSRKKEADNTIALRQLNCPPALITKLILEYGAEAYNIVIEDPFQLITRFHGVGFKIADAISSASGLPLTSSKRIQAGILHTMRESTRKGHTFLPHSEMCREACRLLGLSWDVVSAELPSLETAGDVVLDGSAVYLTNLLKAEHAVSCNLLALMSTAPGTEAGPADFSIMPFELDIRQKDAIESGRHSKVLVITGGPGTGKTTLCRVLLTAFKGQRIALASPTGVAAKRIATATGLFASTIHRLLEYHPHLGWRRNQRNQLDADIVLVDEVSMVDINLMKRLTDAIPPTCRLILVGDADQLPSVGPGRVLGDIITSGKIPIVELTQIQRQGPLSKIIVNAHRVNHGLELDLPEPPDNGEKPDPTDFYMIRRSTKEGCAQLAVELASEILPDRFGYDPMADIWVITPQNVGDCGTVALNAHLQAVLNPNGEKVPFLPKKGFRIGDLAMQWKNDYELGVFNGDRGRILSFDEKKEEMTVQIEGENSPTVYGKASASNLRLAYASTVHKSQGNERKCVVLVMHKTHTRMLQRSLLYTGMTRAVELLIIIGQMHAVQIATRTVSKETRHSGLGFRLSESEGESSPILVEADGVDPLGIS